MPPLKEMDDDAMLKRQLKEYEDFVSKVLTPKLTALVKTKTEYEDEIEGYDAVLAKLQHTSPISSTSLAVIGNGIKVQAETNDCSKLYIHVGLGFCVELEHDECCKVAQKRIAIIQPKLEKVHKECIAVAADVESALKMIAEAKAQ